MAEYMPLDMTNILDNIKKSPSILSDKLKSFFPTTLNRQATVAPTADNVVYSAYKQQIIVKLISTCIGVGASLVISYLALKWLSNVLDPTNKDKKDAQKKAEVMMKRIGVTDAKLSEYELCIASNLIDPLGMEITWADIGGLDDIIRDIEESLILPISNREFFEGSKLLQPPKGVLLYGPPGCGKTLIAKAIAKAAGARFINLQVSSLMDKWYGESQKRAEAIFTLAVKIQPTIIFIDEIDSFLRSRSVNDHEATVMLKTQFMSFWDGLITDPKSRVVIVGATNRPNDIDQAILRRMANSFYIGLPNEMQRTKILKVILRDELVGDDVDLEVLASITNNCSGSDLRELCRASALFQVREQKRAGEDVSRQAANLPQLSGARGPIMWSHFTKAVEKMIEDKNSMKNGHYGLP